MPKNSCRILEREVALPVSEILGIGERRLLYGLIRLFPRHACAECYNVCSLLIHEVAVGMGIGIDRLVMMMTGEQSIQDVLLFPQMKPEKKAAVTTDAEFVEHGVPAEWVPMLRKAGINTLSQLKEANPNKLYNDLNGLRKKNKLDIPPVQKEAVEAWITKE